MTAITALSKQNKQAGPEEKLRASLISYMTEELGFPSSSILKEKTLSSLSCLLPNQSTKLPLRRVDIAITAPCTSHGLCLLMIVECKVDAFFESSLSQVLGYSHHLLSPFIWIASEKRSSILFWDRVAKAYHPFEGSPSYSNLLRHSKDPGA